MLSYTNNEFILDKLSYTEEEEFVCSVQDMAVTDSTETTIQAGNVADDKLVVFGNKFATEQINVYIFDTVEETWSEKVALGPALENVSLLTLPS